jgi:hypothetical protein
MTAVYQSICVTCAMFYTGQASNLAADIAGQAGFTITWASWFVWHRPRPVLARDRALGR